tara:strand:- start:263 stop:424 length:162 start_codon:yes stop_codon:yes gene_type:complete
MPNQYFKLMLEAKAENKESFVYNGNKYVAGTTKTGLRVYRKEGKKEPEKEVEK